MSGHTVIVSNVKKPRTKLTVVQQYIRELKARRIKHYVFEVTTEEYYKLYSRYPVMPTAGSDILTVINF